MIIQLPTAGQRRRIALNMEEMFPHPEHAIKPVVGNRHRLELSTLNWFETVSPVRQRTPCPDRNGTRNPEQSHRKLGNSGTRTAPQIASVKHARCWLASCTSFENLGLSDTHRNRNSVRFGADFPRCTIPNELTLDDHSHDIPPGESLDWSMYRDRKALRRRTALWGLVRHIFPKAGAAVTRILRGLICSTPPAQEDVAKGFTRPKVRRNTPPGAEWSPPPESRAD